MVNKIRRESKSERAKRVLEMIVRYHTSTAEPVGSHAISREIDLSSATIRNIMLELEEDGLIHQPHISAGRVPTDKGYRSYVNSLMEGEGLLEAYDEGAYEAMLSLKADSMEDVVLRSLQLCSKMTAQACVALFPTMKIREYLIEKMEDRINDLFASLYDFGDRLYLDGAHYLAEQPEFKDAEKISYILRMLEDKKRLLEVLERDLNDDNIKIHIGKENSELGIDECALITASYDVDGSVSGRLGIIGPIRMEYQRVIPAVRYIAESMGRLFEEVI